MLNLQQRFAAIRHRLEPLERAHPNAVLAAAIVSFTLFIAILGGSTWLVYDIFHDLPSASELRDVASMAQATTIYDRNNRTAFTIFQERRIETSLSEISPHLVHAVISVEDQRFYDHRSHSDCCRRGDQPAGAPRSARWKHAHTAARATELPDVGQNAAAEVEGSGARVAPGARIHEGSASRAVFQ
jgi:membrane peptidoglycan carboxypeptidase